MRQVFVFTAVGLVAACSPSPQKQAEEIIRHDMLDPEATQFRDVETLAGSRCVKGELNAKNSMGAYTGFRPFIIDLSTKKYGIAPDASPTPSNDDVVAAARLKVVESECQA